MNKFIVFPCIEEDEAVGYDGPVIPLASTSDMASMLFFPIAPDYAHLINCILTTEGAPDSDLQMLGVYETMLNSWRAGDRYLSGIVMDVEYDEEVGEEIISPSLIICDATGSVDAVLNVNFVHAVMLAAMERKEILVTNDLINKLIPVLNGDEEMTEDDEPIAPSQGSPFPVDKQILDIARDIMDGKSSNTDQNTNEE